MKNVLCILFLLVSLLGNTQNNALFEQGSQSYATGKYQDAINSWTKVLSNEKHSSSLFFNLGNAYYKLNQIGPSVFYYEKALLLDPTDSEIKNNLAFAENARVDAIETLPKSVFSKWYSSTSGQFSFDGWAWIAVAFSLLFVCLFLGYYFAIAERKKRMLFVTAIVSLLLLCVSIAMAYQTAKDIRQDAPAIIFAESTEVRSEPNMGSETSFTLHEGTKVQILTEEKNWVRIQIADGKDGWMPLSDLKAL